ncbi:MAG TPA: Ig-like domain-containing protein [Solirubrobacter sp.]
MVRRLAVSIALILLALPASARAADVSVDANHLLHYTAAAGKVNNATFAEGPDGTVTVGVASGDQDPLVAGTGCSAVAATVVCPGVANAVIDAGDMSDRVTAYSVDEANNNTFQFGLTTIPAIINGGDGNDALAGGARGDTIDGGAGNDDIDGFAGNDTLRGGDGNDILRPNTGTDTMVGGDGIDTASYGKRFGAAFSLDGIQNDGGPTELDGPPENDLIGTDVENVEGAVIDPSQTITLTGDSRANRLTAISGKAVITGGEGADVLEGGPQDDTINARDGSPDTVICNGGTDTVLADTLDVISPSCENVQVQASPGGPFDDHAPTLAWAAPGSGADLSANATTLLSVTAADDRGLAKVQFFDDDRLLCEVVAAPFNCAYQPRGGDVGRNTLIAVAFDGAGQTTSAVRAVTVRRFAAKSMTLTLRPSRDRKAPYAFSLTGKITRPDPVSPSQGCTGTITFSAKRGSKLISSKRVGLTRTCEYKTTFSFKTRTASSVHFQAKFGGNEILSGISSKSRTARLG